MFFFCFCYMANVAIRAVNDQTFAALHKSTYTRTRNMCKLQTMHHISTYILSIILIPYNDFLSFFHFDIISSFCLFSFSCSFVNSKLRLNSQVDYSCIESEQKTHFLEFHFRFVSFFHSDMDCILKQLQQKKMWNVFIWFFFSFGVANRKKKKMKASLDRIKVMFIAYSSKGSAFYYVFFLLLYLLIVDEFRNLFERITWAMKQKKHFTFKKEKNGNFPREFASLMWTMWNLLVFCWCCFVGVVILYLKLFLVHSFKKIEFKYGVKPFRRKKTETFFLLKR